jgi:hypothetical protein
MRRQSLMRQKKFSILLARNFLAAATLVGVLYWIKL